MWGYIGSIILLGILGSFVGYIFGGLFGVATYRIITGNPIDLGAAFSAGVFAYAGWATGAVIGSLSTAVYYARHIVFHERTGTVHVNEPA